MKDYFYFEVGKNVRLVLPADWVVETAVLPITQICPIPGVADMFLGVMNYHGELIWVIDLAQYLSHLIGLVTVPSSPDNTLTKEKLVLITLGTSQKENSSQPVAWVVSQVHGIVALNPAKFRPIPAPFKSLLDRCLSGLTELEVKPESISTASTTVAALSSLFLEPSAFSTSKPKS